MLVSVLRYIKGYIKIRIDSGSPERFINACRYRNIDLWGLQYRNSCYEMYITIAEFKKIKPIIRKTGTKVIIIGRFGLPFFFHRYKKRKIFLIGAVGNVLLVYILSLFVWNIDVTGNISYSDEALIKFLEEKNICHGMTKKNVDCSYIVKEIRKKYDDIIWVSASLEGSRLLVQIKENETLEQEKILLKKHEITGNDYGEDIVSTKDCTIKEIITRKGVPLVNEGNVVKQGEVLVTGLIEVLNDNKEIIGYQIENAQADIRGKVTCDYKDKQSVLYEEKEYMKQKKEELYFKLNNILFWIGDKKNRFEKSECILIEKQLCIGERFYLPIWYGKKITKPYESYEKKYNQKEIQNKLTYNFKKYCEDLEKKGVEILENSVKIYTERNFAIAEGTLTIICDIGEKKKIKIPEFPMEEEINGND